jgi:drug/metabolite transporter (DMT)-like permease
VTVLGEPVGATLLAALIPSIAEVPGALTLTGGAIVLAGILLTARRDRIQWTDSSIPNPIPP